MPNDHFFRCDMVDLIRANKPRLWLHGHTHTPCDYDFHATRVICNPRGYPGERSDTYAPLEIEV